MNAVAFIAVILKLTKLAIDRFPELSRYLSQFFELFLSQKSCLLRKAQTPLRALRSDSSEASGGALFRFLASV